MARKFTATLGLFLLTLAITFMPMAVFADAPANPDSAPTVSEIHINRNLITTGDIVITGLYNIPYASYPSLPANQTFLIRLLDTDGTSELGSITPFAYQSFNYGYNKGVFSFYFPAGSGLTWGDTYIIQISENPSQFASPQVWNTTIPSSAYTSLTTQANNINDLASYIYNLGTILDSAYNIQMFSSSGTAQVLSSDGENYFRGAIPGLQALAPVLFVIQQSNVDLTGETWTTNAFDAYNARFNNTWVGDAQTATGDMMGMSGNMAMGMIIIAPVCLGMLIFSGMKFHSTDPGLIGSSVVLEMGAIMGWVPPALFATIFQVMAIYIAYLFFYSRG